MSQFIQLHILTSYAPSNVNRDDLGRPKTAKMGGFERLRISSQCLKRHWRTSNLFQEAIHGKLGIRTKYFGEEIYAALLEQGMGKTLALKCTESITSVFGKVKKVEDNGKHRVVTEQLVHISPNEEQKVLDLVKILANEKREPTKEELDTLMTKETSVDIALFGRMLASAQKFNVEAACQVAHAISVHQVSVEDDYFTAIDDLNDVYSEDNRSAHIGETGFAAALFYSYICINKTQLIENLHGNEELANVAIAALTEVAVKVSPNGKQNSFASRAYASYVMAEKGQQQPRSLSVAFLKPISSGDVADSAIASLKRQIINFDTVYGNCADDRCELNAMTGEGSLADLLSFVQK